MSLVPPRKNKHTFMSDKQSAVLSLCNYVHYHVPPPRSTTLLSHTTRIQTVFPRRCEFVSNIRLSALGVTMLLSSPERESDERHGGGGRVCVCVRVTERVFCRSPLHAAGCLDAAAASGIPPAAGPTLSNERKRRNTGPKQTRLKARRCVIDARGAFCHRDMLTHWQRSHTQTHN